MTAIASISSASPTPNHPMLSGTLARLTRAIVTASRLIVRMDGHEGSRREFNNKRDFFAEEKCTISLLIPAGVLAVRTRLRQRFRAKYAAHFSAQLSGDSVCVDSVSNDLRSDKDNELGSSHGPGGTR